MKNQRHIIRLLAMLLAAMLITFNCNSACSITTYAASATSFDQVKNLLPIGTTLKEDSFPGLLLSFNGQGSYEVGKGANTLKITITILDEKSAKKSLSAIQLLFGPITIDLKTGATTSVKSKVSGVTADSYKELVSKLGDAKLSNLLSKLLNKNTLTAESLSAFTDYVVALSTANEYENFMRSVEKARELEAEKTSVVNIAVNRGADKVENLTPADPNKGGERSDSTKPSGGNDETKPSGGGDSTKPSESGDGTKPSEGGGSFAPDDDDEDGDEDDDDEDGDDEDDEDDDDEDGDDEDEDDDDEDDDDEDDDEDDVINRAIMIFLNGTDLEGNGENATKNLLDLLSTQIPDNTRVFITTGGTTTWHMNDKAAFKTYAKNKLYPKLLDVDLDKPENVGKKNEIQNLADDYYKKYSLKIGSNIQIYEVSKGETNKLSLVKEIPDKYFLDHSYISEFINYVTDSTEAQKYDLIMWDHGNGIKGFGSDEIYEAAVEKNAGAKRDDVGYKNIETLKKAIAECQLIKDGGKFDFLGFDACQMATIEVATDIMDLADYLILSEEDEPGAGWNYARWMGALYSNPDMETTELGTVIVDSFIEQYKDNKDGNSTLGLIETDKLDEVDEALSEFLRCLVRDYLSNEYHEEILNVIGKIGDFGNRYGDERQGLLDICHLCRPFLGDERESWNPDLVEASENLNNAVQDAVVTAKGTQGINNNGLSINMPLNVYSFTYAGRNDDGEEVYNTTFVGKDTIEILNQIDINSDLKKAYAQIALNRLAANVVGEMWLFSDVTTEQVVDTLTAQEDAYKAKVIVEASGADLKDTTDDVRESLDHLVEQRVAISNASIVYGEDGQGNAADSEVAYIVLENVNPIVLDDSVSLNVVLKDGNNEYPLGTTPLYSVGEDDGSTDNSKSWKLRKYDNKWYTLNDQISDFYVTDYNSELNTYSGYIILGLWNNTEDVAGDDEEDRTDYVIQQESDGNISIIHLNVKGEYNPDTGETLGLTPINYAVTQGDEPATTIYPAADLENCYLEILANRGSAMNSIGTVYAGLDEDQPGAGILRLDVRTILDLQQNYSISDIYGTTYEFSDKVLKNLDDEEKAKSLDAFVAPIETEALTYEQSQQAAAEIRQQAADEAENEDEEGDGEGDDDEGDDEEGDDGDDQDGDDAEGDGDDQDGDDAEGDGDDQDGDDAEGDGDDQDGDDAEGDGDGQDDGDAEGEGGDGQDDGDAEGEDGKGQDGDDQEGGEGEGQSGGAEGGEGEGQEGAGGED